MKRIWFAVAFLIIAAIACVFEQYNINSFCNKTEELTDAAIIALKNGDNEKYDEAVNGLLDFWNEKNDLLFALSGHVLLDELSIKINSLKNRSEHIYDVKAVLRAYRENGIVKLSNIL